MAGTDRPEREATANPEDEPDFASEHSLVTTSEVVSAGQDAHSDPDIPSGLGGMDLKRTRLLD
ncbi:hypothetical protein Rhe02_06990 [Rhizocola hellebori]|uniref:Uncharacterized protein n=1 Tax=Rhizocola hellebori TaxID=1392758 RepID=A0A8J3Q3E9_9ACTN|nr:hypothetical protein [Rhizocola hellebori]GIH02632.1 hypothetical protein Rhe02_06990 [Rhizocola hellebori]